MRPTLRSLTWPSHVPEVNDGSDGKDSVLFGYAAGYKVSIDVLVNASNCLLFRPDFYDRFWGKPTGRNSPHWYRL